MPTPIKAVAVPRSLLRRISSNCRKKEKQLLWEASQLDPLSKMTRRKLELKSGWFKGRGDFARELLMISDAVEKGMKERGEI
jgi:hypothetical protein